MDQTFFIHLFKEYGYLLLFVWSIFEGEIGLIIAGILSSKGMVFDFQNVIVIAAFGALIGDNTLFFLGRIYDAKNSEFYKKYKNPIEKMGSIFN